MSVKFQYTPSAYKAGKTYTEIPNVDAADLSLSRASSATRINEDGQREVMGDNVPRMDYTDGGCPVLLTEPQAETLFQNSGWFGGSGVLPTNWTSTNEGVISSENSILGNLVNAYKFDTDSSDSRPYFTQGNISFLNGSTYSLSVFVEEISTGSNISIGSILIAFISSQNSKFFENGVEVPSNHIISQGNYYETTFESTSTSNGFIRLGLGVSTNVSANNYVVMSSPQLEEGSKRTSFILSPIGGTAVRLADTGIETGDISQYIDSSNFTLETEQSSFNDGSSTYEIGLNNGTFSTATRLSYSPTIGRILATITKAGETPISLVANGVSKEDFNKTKITVIGQNASLFINDVLEDSSNFFGYSQGDLKFLSLDNGQGSSSFKGKIKYIKIS